MADYKRDAKASDKKNYKKYMKYYLSLLAFGDNLISLSLLQRLDADVYILGTKHTKDIAQLLNIQNDKFHIKVVFEDIPAFYDIKRQGILQAIKDLARFIMFVKDNKIKELVFEKKDFRAYVICFFTQATPYFSVSSTSNVYERRKELIEKVYGKEVTLSVYKFKILNPKIILINPLTRSEARNIKKEHLKNILEFLNLYEYEIYLIDIEKRYEDLKMNVKYYLTDTTLQDIRSLLLKSDFYIGGDSFLIHLAYYLKRNYFMIFYRDNDDFLPPNISCDFYIKAHRSDNFRKEIEEKFIKIGLINT